MQKETVYIIDAHNFLYRNYYALPKLSTSAGMEVGALYGFVKWLAKLAAEKKPKYIAVCFDSPGGSKQRKEKYAQYKAHRKEADEALILQLNEARSLVSSLGIKVFAESGLEADDIMACIALAAERDGAHAVLVTSDKDICQILGENIKLWPSGNFKEEVVGPEYVKHKFGIDKRYLLDYFSIVGDSSDNIPGIEGLGPKTTVSLIEKYGHLDDILAAAERGDKDLKEGVKNKVLAGKESALLSRDLFKIDCDSYKFMLDDALFTPPPADKLAAVFSHYEFKNMLNAFAAPAPAPQKAAQASLFEETAQTSFDEIEKKLEDKLFIYAEDEDIILGINKDKFLIKKIADVTESEKEFITKCLDNTHIKKVSYEIKNTLRLLNLKTDFKNTFDLRLAAYTLNPGSDLSFAGLLLQILNISVSPADDEELLKLINTYAFQLADILEKDLEDKEQTNVYQHLEIPLSKVLLDMELAGIKIDKKWFEHFGAMLEKDMTALQVEINTMAGGDININSPKQLGVLLFETLHLPVQRKTKTGYSTDEEALTALSSLHPIAKKILDYRASAKLKSTYVDNLLVMADADSRVHTYFDATGTITGRLSSSAPNLQNIPVRTEKGRLIRKGFCAGEGNILLALDYSQIDLRVLAHESGDEVLVQAFKDGGDIHSKTAAEVFGVMKDMVSPEMRSSAKAINFGIVYGQGPVGLSQSLNIPLREAKEYIENYFLTYKGVRKWIDENIALARKNGYVKTFMGHIRYLPEFGAGSAQMSAFAERAAINTIVQGGSSDIIKKAMVEIYKEFKDTDVKMLLQVHDELIFEIPQAKLEHAAKIIKHKMEHAFELKVPLLAEAKAGKNWYDMERIKP